MSDPCASRTPAEFGHCHEAHVSITLVNMDHEVVRGSHLRWQRRIAGISTKSLADAASLSPTRIRQLESSDRVTSRAAVRYLDAVGEAWRRRAAEAAQAEEASS